MKSLVSRSVAIDDLVENLVSQVEMHEVLLEILGCEMELPASCSLHELIDIQSTRDMASVRIHEIEQQRLRWVEIYKMKNNIQHKLTFDEITGSSEQNQKETLLNLREQLRELLNDIRKISKQNADRANARIACFGEVEKAIHRTFHRQPTYSGKGVMTRQKGEFLIRKSI